MAPADGGLVVVDKPSGWTSHQVVARCRRLLGTRKVGHAGTLDPMATGLLLVGFGRATRLLGYLAKAPKTYVATIRLGQSTITDDAEGEVVAAVGAAGLTEGDVRAALPAFTGVISQVPSAVSAIKVDGKRAYARVRAGEDVQLAAREVTVSRFEVLAVRRATSAERTVSRHDGEEPSISVVDSGYPVAVLDVDVVVDCSSGTYIRALARDLGERLGVGGHLTALRRTRIGAAEQADIRLDAAGLAGDARPEAIGMVQLARDFFPVAEVTAEQASDIGFGRSLRLAVPADPTAMVYGDQLLALYRPDGEVARPVAVLA
ncbi:MAG TPA: tRNA pseudouridine(55) synthase TruB [Propionicimonas sp.]|nr:tRNA pseudouridine(55) synthase TruB [Propionicimonas sp.]HQA77203.1 tRNA pseudouridine(55) synthase TruB [Propionicimonas sp.]HQD96847.1 tRNA pseudouridine(55) synthase TruB [Propionicimonas sp.]